MIKILKITEPDIRTYLGDAFCFSIINDDAFKTGWIFDKYINLEYTEWDRHIKYFGNDYYDFAVNQGVFIKSFTQVPRYLCKKIFLYQLIEKMLLNNEYFVGFWNESVINNFFTGEKIESEFEHLCFIYGFDSGKRVFFSEGYVKENMWQKFCLPYDVVENALISFENKIEIGFNGYQVINNYNWNIDAQNIIYNLKRFFDYSSLNIKAEEHFFCDVLFYKTIHQQSVYCIYEHKRIMEKRLAFLYKQGYMQEDKETISTKYHRLVNLCKNLVLLSLKYQNDISGINLDRIISNSQIMLSEEYEIMQLVISSLKSSNY